MTETPGSLYSFGFALPSEWINLEFVVRKFWFHIFGQVSNMGLLDILPRSILSIWSEIECKRRFQNERDSDVGNAAIEQSDRSRC